VGGSKLFLCANIENYVEPSQTPYTGSDIDSVFDVNAPASSSRISTPASSRTSRSKTLDRELPKIKVEPVTLDDKDPVVSESELSDLSSNEDFDDATHTIVRKPHSKQLKRRSLSKAPSSTTTTIPALVPPDDSPESTSTPTARRRPGDYVRVASLLSEPYARWVDCQTCRTAWVQPNGYYTRKECPRCERHSKLYGYQWPQTDPVKGETVGRVLDHRTVHRFLGPEAEARVRKRGAWKVKEQEEGKYGEEERESGGWSTKRRKVSAY
jgi:histone-lysine N-methyltransferase SUV420H